MFRGSFITAVGRLPEAEHLLIEFMHGQNLFVSDKQESKLFSTAYLLYFKSFDWKKFSIATSSVEADVPMGLKRYKSVGTRPRD